MAAKDGVAVARSAAEMELPPEKVSWKQRISGGEKSTNSKAKDL